MAAVRAREGRWRWDQYDSWGHGTDVEAEEPSGSVTQVVTEEPASCSGTGDARLRVIEIRLGDDIETPEGGEAILLEAVVRATW